MKKLTINNFSGGIQELTMPEDFTDRQWARLQGIIPSTTSNFESQWPMQQIGTDIWPIAIHALVSSSGTYLVAIEAGGTIAWVKSPAATAAYTDALNSDWTTIYESANVDLNGDPIYIIPNEDYKFICNIPLQAYKYVVEVDPLDTDNPSKDEPLVESLGVMSGVVINSTTMNNDPEEQNNQVVVAYIDDADEVVKLLAFPNIRRIPLHDETEGSFIKLYLGDNTYASVGSITTVANEYDKLWTKVSGSWTEVINGITFDGPEDISVVDAYNEILSIVTGSTWPLSEGAEKYWLWTTDTTTDASPNDGTFTTGTFSAYLFRVNGVEVSGQYEFDSLDTLASNEDDDGYPRIYYTGNEPLNDLGEDGDYFWKHIIDVTETVSGDVPHHPYTYLDSNAALLPGRGVIPRANVGTIKNNLLLLGDIQWRSDLSQETPTAQDQYLTSTSGADEFDTREFQVLWPVSPFPDFARVIYNQGGGFIYLKDDGNLVADIVDFDTNNGVATLTTQLAHGFTAGETVEISNMNDILNGTYEILASPAPTTYTFSISKVYTGRDITHRSSSTTTRTLTTASNHNLLQGQYVTITNVGADYNGSFVITGITNTTFTYTAGTSVTEANTAVSPNGKVDIPPTPIRTINGDGQYLTVELGPVGGSTVYTHNYLPGRFVHLKDLNGTDSVSGNPSLINGIYEIIEVPSSSKFVIKSTYKTAVQITNRLSITVDADTQEARLDTSVNHEFLVGEDVVVSGLGSAQFNGTFDVKSITVDNASAALASNEFVYEFESTKTYSSKAVTRVNAMARSTRKVSAGTSSSPVGRAVCYNYKVDPGSYQTIPNSWVSIYATASTIGTKIKAVKNLNTAYLLLNDENTGPHRGAMYFATGGDIDTFDPRAVLQIGKSDVVIAGMHVLNDTVIAITTAGGPNDGVHRIRGYLSRLIQYGTQSDPNAVRIELLRGGLGAPERTSTRYKAYSCTWSEAGIVVFLDRLGGIWYTNGNTVDRLDRIGPVTPTACTDDDHTAALGKHLFVWRDGRLLCLTMLESGSGTGSACWTEISVPDVRTDPTEPTPPYNSSYLSSMTTGGQEVFFILDSAPQRKVVRMTRFAPTSEYGCFNGNPLDITVSTGTIGDSGSHRRTNWHRFGMTFSTPTSCTVERVKVQSTGALNVSHFVENEYDADDTALPNVQYMVNLDRTFDDPGIVGEFIVPAGIGTQAMASATVTFTGYVRLQSASFWVTGDTPRVGDL